MPTREEAQKLITEAIALQQQSAAAVTQPGATELVRHGVRDDAEVVTENDSGNYEVHLSMTALVLLQQINSPYMLEPAIGPDGKPIPPELDHMDIMLTFYVLLNAHKPSIVDIIDDEKALRRCVFEMFSRVGPSELDKMRQAIERGIQEFNDSMRDANLGGNGETEKNV